jgi:hypothetical protein
MASKAATGLSAIRVTDLAQRMRATGTAWNCSRPERALTRFGMVELGQPKGGIGLGAVTTRHNPTREVNEQRNSLA